MKWLQNNFKELPVDATDIIKEQYALEQSMPTSNSLTFNEELAWPSLLYESCGNSNPPLVERLTLCMWDRVLFNLNPISGSEALSKLSSSETARFWLNWNLLWFRKNYYF